MTPESIAALERILIVLTAGIFAYLGFRLYVLGVSKGASKLQAKSAWGEFVMSGTGPGLVFMAFGGAILVYALATSGVRSRSVEQVQALPASAPMSAAAASATAVITTRTVEFASSAPAAAK